MKTPLKKVMAYFLVLALCLGGVSYQGKTVKAEDYIELPTIANYSGDPIQSGYANFYNPANGDLYFGLSIGYSSIGFSYTITNTDSGLCYVNNKYISATSSNWFEGDSGLMLCMFNHNLTAGNYKLDLKFDQEVSTIVVVGNLYPTQASATPTPTPTVKPTATPSPTPDNTKKYSRAVWYAADENYYELSVVDNKASFTIQGPWLKVPNFGYFYNEECTQDFYANISLTINGKYVFTNIGTSRNCVYEYENGIINMWFEDGTYVDSDDKSACLTVDNNKGVFLRVGGNSEANNTTITSITYNFVFDNFNADPSKKTTGTTSTNKPTTTATPSNTTGKTAPSLASKSLTLTKGFKGKISVVNAGGAKLSYTSSNNKVVTVDSVGTLVAKKKGTAVITVKTSTGYTLSCNVTVQDNVYSKSKTAVSKFKKTLGTDVYKVSYDKKGNLLIKARLINKGKIMMNTVNLKIVIKNSSGKKIGVYSVKNKPVNIKAGKAKTFTFKIKKTKLNIKTTQDLRRIKKPKVSSSFIINSSKSDTSGLSRG